MTDKKHGFFRKEGIERLSSPERLDRLLQVVRPLDWLPLIVLGILGSLGVGWSIFGKIPVVVTGQGVLTQEVQELEAGVAGTIESLVVSEGQCIARNDLIATIRPVELEQQAQEESENLLELQQQIQEKSLQRLRQNQLEKQAIDEEAASLRQQLRATQTLAITVRDQGLRTVRAQQQNIQRRLQELQTLTPQLEDQELNALEQQRETLQQQIDETQALEDAYKAQLDKRKALREKGAISDEIVLMAEQDYRQARQEIAEIEARLKQLDEQEASTRKEFLADRNDISDLQAELQQLQVQEAELLQKYFEDSSRIAQIRSQLDDLEMQREKLQQDQERATQNEQQQLLTAQQTVVQLQGQLNSTQNREIKSPIDACLLEVSVVEGDALQPRTQIAKLGVKGANPSLKGVIYFSVEDGQRVAPEMRTILPPSTLEGGNFGGILGEITAVSPLPVDFERATGTIGNSELAKTLWGEASGQYEAIAQLSLDREAPSGYKWSTAQSPDVELSPGTLTTARITVEERSPITFVLPTLRTWSGWN
ncbi:MAG: biotin/lipoyl-binding protein [Microcoleaceae cyanobacterium]